MASVLYVEDDFPNLEMATLLLESYGHTVKGARDGQQGLEVLAREGGIQIICTDYHMPGMNGYDLTRAIKTDPKFAEHSAIPIIGVGDFPANRQEHLVRCMPKPYTPEELLKCIDQNCK